MPDGRTESYEAVPRRPEQQGTKGPALSMALCSLFLCYHVSNIPCPYLNPLLLIEPVHLLPCLLLQATCLPVYSSTCQLATLPCLNHTLSLSQTSVTPRTCSSVTLSPITSNLFTCLLVHLSTCHVTLSFSYPVSLSTLPCPLILLTLSLPCHKKVKPYSFTFFFFPLLSLLIRSRAVTTKTYFVCPP